MLFLYQLEVRIYHEASGARWDEALHRIEVWQQEWALQAKLELLLQRLTESPADQPHRSGGSLPEG